MPESMRSAAVEAVLRENDYRPIGYQSPGKFNTSGAVAWGIVLALAFGWIAIGIIQAPFPDYLVHPVIDNSTDPGAHLLGWIFGY